MDKETLDFISVRERHVSLIHNDTVRGERGRADNVFQAVDKQCGTLWRNLIGFC